MPDYEDDEILLEEVHTYQRNKRRRKLCIMAQVVALLLVLMAIVVLGVWLDLRQNGDRRRKLLGKSPPGNSTTPPGQVPGPVDLKAASRGAAHWKQDKEDATLITLRTIDQFLIKVREASDQAGGQWPSASVIAPQTVIAYIRDMRLDSLWQILRDFAGGKRLADLPPDQLKEVISSVKKMVTKEGVNQWGQARATRHITKGNVAGRVSKEDLMRLAELKGYTIEDFEADEFPTPVVNTNKTESGTANTTRTAPKPGAGNRRLLATGFHDLCIPVVINVMQYPHKDGALPEVGRYKEAASYLIEKLNKVFSNGEYLETDGREDKKTLVVPRIQFTLAEIRDDAEKHRYLLMQDEAMWNLCNTKDFGHLLETAQQDSALDPTQNVNIFVCGYAALGAPGWAFVPGGEGYNESSARLQHVVLAHEVLSQYGQGMNRPEAFDEGAYQAAHQIGHHLGLDHPHEGGCDEDGDQVDDTPQTKVVAEQDYFFDLVQVCDSWRRTRKRAPQAAARGFDSCPSNGDPDPVFNWMEITAPSCMSSITARQVQRLHLSILYYRPGLYKNSKGRCPA